jgi:cell division protein YceG involved in septum cleavage
MTAGYFVLSVLLVVAFYSLSHRGYDFCRDVFGDVRMSQSPGKAVSFRVESADSFQQVAERLEQKKIIADKNSFYVRTCLMNPDKIMLQPGDYVLRDSMTYEEIINSLTISEGVEE